MKVKELIEKLQEMPQDFDVVFMHPEFGEYGVIDFVHTIDTEGNCEGDFCDNCVKCHDYKTKDNAVELCW